MAGRANNKNTQVAYIAEVTPGVTPATPAFNLFRATGEAIDINRKLVFSGELDGKRGEKNYSVAAKSSSGSLNFEWSYGLLHDFLEGALRNTWASDVLVDSNLQKTFTIEAKFETGASDIYKRATGSEVSSLALNLRTGEITTGEVAFMGLDGDFANAAIAGATYVAAGTNPILNGGDFGALTAAGLTIGCVSSLTMNLNNNLSEVRCLGTLAATDFSAGTVEVTGTISVVLTFDEYDILRAYADGVSTGLSFEIGRTAGQKTRIELPNVVLSDMTPKADDTNGGIVLLTANYRALQASTLSGSVIRATRAI